MKLSVFTVVIALGVGLTESTTSAQSSYQYGTLGDYDNAGDSVSWYWSDVNNNGVVIGTEQYAAEGRISYGGLVRGRSSTGLSANSGINNSNDVAGAVYYQVAPWDWNVYPVPAVDIGGTRIELSTSPGRAYDINDSRIVVGSGGGQGSLWTWNASDGTFQTLRDSSQAFPSGRPRINARGQVAADGFLYTPGQPTVSVPSEYTFVAGLNDAGDMLVRTSSGTTRSLLRYADGTQLELSSLVGGHSTFGHGLTNSGSVIFSTNEAVNSGPYVWSPSEGLRRIRDLVSFPSGTDVYRIAAVDGVSDNGRFAGLLERYWEYGRIQSLALFTPVPAPGALEFLTIGGVGLARRRRRQADQPHGFWFNS